MDNKIIFFSVLFSIAVVGLAQDVSAFSGTISDKTSCESIPGAVWTDPNTCTITSDQIIAPGDTWSIPASVTLVINSGVSVSMSNEGVSTGISNDGTLENSGSITITNDAGFGIDNSGTLTNLGTITISNTGNMGIFNDSGTINNLGNITISNTTGGGIFNQIGTITNSGSMTITNSAGTGITIFGNFFNSGIVTISNSNGIGIYSNFSTINTSGTLIISNTNGTGISNDFSTMVNLGNLTISNIDGIGIDNNPSSFAGIIFNSGNLTNSNTGGTGINNPSASIYNCDGVFFGNAPIGDPIIADCIPCTPSTPNWTITFPCRLETSTNIPGNVLIQDNLVLIIPAGVILGIDFTDQNLTIGNGSRAVIESGGSIKSEQFPPMNATVSIPKFTSFPGCEFTNECFIPFDVMVAVGGTVTWTNDDTADHSVVSGTTDNPMLDDFNSGLFSSGETFSHTFPNAGTFDYFCLVHPWQTGTVTVTAP